MRSRFPRRHRADGFVMLKLVRIVAAVFIAAGIIALLIPWKNRKLSMIIPATVAATFVLLLVCIHFINQSAIAHGLPSDFNFGAGMLTPGHMRIPGVLQRIAVCYVIAASIALFAGWRTVLLAVAIFLAAYSLLMLKVSYPSLINPAVRVTGTLEKQDNFARYVDTTLLRKHAYNSYPDPEGIVSTLPAVATTLLGIIAGIWLMTSRSSERRCAGLFALGVVMTSIGYILTHALMPLNKQIWTPSYAVYTAGLGMLGLGLCFWLVDILGWRRTMLPLRVYGMNAIAAFVLAGVIGRLTLLIHLTTAHGEKLALMTWFVRGITQAFQQAFGADSFWSSAYNISLAYALCYVLVFLAVMWLLYALKIFVKV